MIVEGAGRVGPDMFSFGFQRTIGPGANHIACEGQTRVRMILKRCQIHSLTGGHCWWRCQAGGGRSDEEKDHIALF